MQTELADFTFTIDHRPGKDNGNADTLSRNPAFEEEMPKAEVYAVTRKSTKAERQKEKSQESFPDESAEEENHDEEKVYEGDSDEFEGIQSQR